MIDLNEVEDRPATQEHIDVDAIRAKLADNLAWVEDVFPSGQKSRDGHFWCLADWSGRPPTGEGSCRINLTGDKAGWGYDFSTQDGEDPIGVIGRACGLSGRAMLEEAARIAGMAATTPTRPARKPRDLSQEIANILAGTEPLAGTLGETYLASRGLSDPNSPDLLFHSDLTADRRGWCGLVAIVRNGAGERSGAIHRTFLLDDGSAKAPPGRKALGPIMGGAVRLAAIGDDGHVGIAEGIETAIAATAIFGAPCWAALTAGGVAAWEWPREARRVTIFADAGKAGMSAAAKLAERIAAADIPAEIRQPLHGDDFNDDLKHGASAGDYPPLQPQCLPAPTSPIASYTEMEQFAAALAKPVDGILLGRFLAAIVRAQVEPIAERQLLMLIKQNAGIDIGTLREQIKILKRRMGASGDPDAAPARPQWAAQLRMDIFGQPERNELSVITALSNDEAFAGVIAFDEFRQEAIARMPTPWDNGAQELPRNWRDTDDIRCAEWLQRREINVSPATVSRSVQAVARDAAFHPVRDYLQSVRWDGVERLVRWPVAYLGAAETTLNCAFGTLWMISAVARVMRPGCKADHILILEGPQGAKKSSALKALAGAEWFTDELAEIGSKDAAQQMRGVWIIEIAELDALGRAEVSRIKAFLSRTVDRYRPPYGRYVIDVPRQCVFAGSVNPDTYLRDETGNRRFWPLRCGTIDIAAITRDRDQLWAEAFALFNQGAVWWLTSPELIAAAKAEQDERFQSDAWDDRIEQWLRNDGPVPRYEPLSDVSISEILEQAIRLETGRWSRGDQMRVAAFLKRNGWERYRAGSGEDRPWRYRRPTMVPT